MTQTISNDLISIDPVNAMTIFKSSDQIEDLINQIENEALSLIPDISNEAGRKEVRAMANKVTKAKTYLDGLGKDLVTELKEIPKLIDANRKSVRDRLDLLRNEVRKPLTQWEEEQDRIKEEESARIAEEKLVKQIDRDHEFALLMNAEFDRKIEVEKLRVIQEKNEREEAIKREVEEQAKREAEEKARAEMEAAARREAEAKLAAERAEREKLEVIIRAEQEQKEAIEQERFRVEQERILLEEESAKRKSDTEHKRQINNQALADLDSIGVPQSMAMIIISAIAKGQITAITINY